MWRMTRLIIDGGSAAMGRTGTGGVGRMSRNLAGKRRERGGSISSDGVGPMIELEAGELVLAEVASVVSMYCACESDNIT